MAVYANKFILSFPIGFIYAAALGACSAGIARVNQNQWNTSKLRFVSYLSSQVGKRPGGILKPLAFSNCDPLANKEIDNNNTHDEIDLLALGLIDTLIRNNWFNPLLEDKK